MVSPGAEAQSGRKFVSLFKMSPYAHYFHATDSRPVDVTAVSHWIRRMIGTKDEAVAGIQVNDHLVRPVVELTGPTGDKVTDVFSTTDVSQPALENPCCFVAQPVSSASFDLADCPEFLSVEGNFQSSNLAECTRWRCKPPVTPRLYTRRTTCCRMDLPGAEDRAITRRLMEAGTLLGISVLDHLILGDRPRRR